MNTYESTISMMKSLPESDLLIVTELVNRLSNKEIARKELYNPYKPLTREEILEKLAEARKHASEGKVMPASEVAASIREKYNL